MVQDPSATRRSPSTATLVTSTPPPSHEGDELATESCIGSGPAPGPGLGTEPTTQTTPADGSKVIRASEGTGTAPSRVAPARSTRASEPPVATSARRSSMRSTVSSSSTPRRPRWCLPSPRLPRRLGPGSPTPGQRHRRPRPANRRQHLRGSPPLPHGAAASARQAFSSSHDENDANSLASAACGSSSSGTDSAPVTATTPAAAKDRRLHRPSPPESRTPASSSRLGGETMPRHPAVPVCCRPAWKDGDGVLPLHRAGRSCGNGVDR